METERAFVVRASYTYRVIPTAILFLVCFVAGARYGTRILAGAIVSFYPAYLVAENLGFEPSSALSLLLTFVALWVGSYFILSRVVDGYDAHDAGKRYMTIAALSAGASWLILLVFHRLIPIDLPFGNVNIVTDFIKTLRFDAAFAIPLATLLLLPKRYY